MATRSDLHCLLDASSELPSEYTRHFANYLQKHHQAEIEAIRGVQAGPILRSLVDRGLARVTGRADVPGHPLQYGTTKDFLDRFGLMGLDDLPRDAELARD